ncbi:MAG: sodium:proton antiporter NhaD [Candidatus Parcubacteria bacterium]|jgi:Na+/H+ antiporter NhaD/arsenite permease-like protein
MSNEISFVHSWYGCAALVVFIIAYILVVLEEHTCFRKSKPVMLAAGIIWMIVGVAVYGTPQAKGVAEHFRHNLSEYAEILLFLLVAMSYVNILTERNVFTALHSRLERGGWTYRQLFWLTGIIAFFLSSVADNLTAALLMGALVVAIGKNSKEFVAVTCVNVVVAANAGGAFSPFGDITTLMVWQEEKATFFQFFHLFIPALVMWLIPAYIMSFSVPLSVTKNVEGAEIVMLKRGAKRAMLLFVCTIATAVLGHNLLHLPPVYGMMFGLVYIKIFGYYLKIRSTEDIPFDVMRHIQELEWDTLLFFYGVIMSIGGLGYMGYLTWLSGVAYSDWTWFQFSHEVSITAANIGVGLLSSIVDNIPIMFAVLSMNPDMDLSQWLLVTLTAGVGGSLLSVGSAAGVALMAYKGSYTFFSHLRWTPVILIGYVASVVVHLFLNSNL